MRPLLRATFLANRNEGKKISFSFVGAIQVVRLTEERSSCKLAQSANGLKI
jgi:hypothetical protein